MDNPAALSDVVANWRPLTVAEETTVQSWLDNAWTYLQIDSPGLVGRIDSGAVPLELVIATLVDAVIRKGRNPDGHRQGSVAVDDASRSWTVDSSRSAGDLYFTETELSRLGGASTNGKAFSVMPS